MKILHLPRANTGSVLPSVVDSVQTSTSFVLVSFLKTSNAAYVILTLFSGWDDKSTLSLVVLVLHLAPLNQLEPLALGIGDRLLHQDRPTLVPGRKDRALPVARPVGDTQAPARLPVEGQARGVLEVFDNLDLVTHNAEITLDGRVHSEPVFNISVDAVGLDLSVAAIVARDDAELQLLEVLIAGDASNEIVADELLGDEGPEVGALEQEGVVLTDRGLGDAGIATDL